MVVLTKIDLCSAEQIIEAEEIVHFYSPFESLSVSSATGQGIDELRSGIMTILHGSPIDISIFPPQNEGEIELIELVSRVYREALVIEVEENSEYTKISGWMGKANISRLTKDHPIQIQISN